MAIPPPPYDGISGIFVQIDKHVDETKAGYDGNARPGQLVVDTSDYSLWIGNSEGALNQVTGGGGGGGNLGNLTISNVTIGTATADNPIIVQPVQVQQPWFISVYGDLGVEINDDYGEGIARDDNGNTYIIGGDGNNGVVSFLAKFDSIGTLEWQKTFDISGNYKSGESVAVDSNGNVFGSFNNYDNGYCYIVKLNSSGTLLWQKELQTNYPDLGNMITDSDNNLYFVLDGTNRTLFKFSPSGTVLWQKETVGGYGLGVSIDANDNVYVGEGPVTKFDSTGTQIYQVQVSTANFGYNITSDPGGNVYVAGAVEVSPGTLNAAVHKLDSTGASVWRTSTDAIGVGSKFYAIDYCAAAGSVIAVSQLNNDLYIVSFNATTGAVNWSNKFGSAGSEGFWYFYGTDFISIKGNVASITGYTNAGSVPNLNALAIAIPTDGTALGIYGDFTYSAVSGTSTTDIGTSTPDSSVNQDASIVVSAGPLTMTNNDYTANTTSFAPGGNQSFIFSSDGSLTFPNGTTQSTALENGMSFTFTNVGATRINMDPIAIGLGAGQTNQAQYGVALGVNAGQTNQGQYAIAIGVSAGANAQASSATAVGQNAGNESQGQYGTAVGATAGEVSQGTYSVAVGSQAGRNSQSTYAVAVGSYAGINSQGAFATAVGPFAGTNQGANSVSVGSYAGQVSQDVRAIAIGLQAGQTSQGYDSVAIGFNAANTSQGGQSVAIGYQSASATQGVQAIAIGYQTGKTTQGDVAIAIGSQTGLNNQGVRAIAIGQGAGGSNQGANSIAIGSSAGQTSQGTRSVAIGAQAGSTNQANNSIVINATTGALENTTANTFIVKPVREVTGGVAPVGFSQVYYNPTTGEFIVVTP